MPWSELDVPEPHIVQQILHGSRHVLGIVLFKDVFHYGLAGPHIVLKAVRLRATMQILFEFDKLFCGQLVSGPGLFTSCRLSSLLSALASQSCMVLCALQNLSAIVRGDSPHLRAMHASNCCLAFGSFSFLYHVLSLPLFMFGRNLCPVRNSFFMCNGVRFCT